MNADRYEIFIGERRGAEITGKSPVGRCFHHERDNHYVMKLMMFPRQTYYLVKNYKSPDRYTVFSKKLNSIGRPIFQNPVGSGKLSTEHPSYLELTFSVLGRQMYMSLFPAGT